MAVPFTEMDKLKGGIGCFTLFLLLCGVEIKGSVLDIWDFHQVSKHNSRVRWSTSNSGTQGEFRTGDINLRVISIHLVFKAMGQDSASEKENAKTEETGPRAEQWRAAIFRHYGEEDQFSYV